MSDWLELPAFAKVNLGLELIARGRDGYWEIRTVYQTIGLCDRLRLRLRRAHPHIRLEVTSSAVPAGASNLVWQALALGRRRFGIRQGVEVELEKNIPVARGLGGGSSDAAVALRGLLRLAGQRVELQELLRLGAGLGADIPFFFLGGRALGVGRGDEVYPLDDIPRAYCALVCPALPIPTHDAYAWAARQRLTPSRPFATIARSSSLRKRGSAFGNDFESVVFPRFPELARIKRMLVAAGAQVASLAGSGATVFGLFSARAPAEAVLQRFPQAEAVFLTETVSRARYQQALGLCPE